MGFLVRWGLGFFVGFFVVAGDGRRVRRVGLAVGELVGIASNFRPGNSTSATTNLKSPSLVLGKLNL